MNSIERANTAVKVAQQTMASIAKAQPEAILV